MNIPAYPCNPCMAWHQFEREKKEKRTSCKTKRNKMAKMERNIFLLFVSRAFRFSFSTFCFPLRVFFCVAKLWTLCDSVSLCVCVCAIKPHFNMCWCFLSVYVCVCVLCAVSRFYEVSWRWFRGPNAANRIWSGCWKWNTPQQTVTTVCITHTHPHTLPGRRMYNSIHMYPDLRSLGGGALLPIFPSALLLRRPAGKKKDTADLLTWSMGRAVGGVRYLLFARFWFWCGFGGIRTALDRVAFHESLFTFWDKIYAWIRNSARFRRATIQGWNKWIMCHSPCKTFWIFVRTLTLISNGMNGQNTQWKK